jgi:SOS-response transcriptional repressor LexA
MTQVDAAGILDIALAGTSATLLARKWESALLVNVDNETLRRILNNSEAMAAVESIEGWRALGDNVIETIINKSETVKELKQKAKDGKLTEKQKKELTEEEKEYKSKRKLVQEKLIKFATRIPAFMYLTDFRENTLQDVITKLEPDLFKTVTGLTVKDFELLVRLKVFNTEQMNQAVFAFRRYEDASLFYTGIESHEGLTHYGLYDTVVARDEQPAPAPERPRLRLVTPGPKERYVKCVPLVPLKAAAGDFGEPHHFDERWKEWVAVETGRKLREGMFVAQVVGKSMEPAIADGSYCLFAGPVEGSRHGRNVLVQLRDKKDPETGERYTVKRYESVKAKDGESWKHTKIILKPLNPKFQAIEITDAEEGKVNVIAELVEMLGRGPLRRGNAREE